MGGQKQYMDMIEWTRILNTTATDIGVGADETVWIIGTKSTGGGYEILKWDGADWTAVEGGAVRIAVDPGGMPWVVNKEGIIYQRKGSIWKQLPGKASDIGVGADETVWITGAKSIGGGYEILKWDGGDWKVVEGGAVRIAVDPAGMPWVINKEGIVHQRKGSIWKELPGKATDIGVGAEGTVWIEGANSTGGNNELLKWDGSDWIAFQGGAAHEAAAVAVGPDGMPWIVGSKGHVYSGYVEIVTDIREQAVNSDTRLIREIKLCNLLSFGPNTQALELENLNVFIGPNGAGKSNLIEAIALMRSTPVPSQTTSNSDILGVLRRGGGAPDWVWKGAKGQPASVELVINKPDGKHPLRHIFSFRGDEQFFQVYDEQVESDKPHLEHTKTNSLYHFGNGHPVLNTALESQRKLVRASVNRQYSILAQRRDPELYPEITYLADTYERLRIYREWVFGRKTILREPQKTDMRNDRLEEDFSNLGMFLSRMRKTPKVKKEILEELRDLYDGLTDFEISVAGGSVEVYFTEGDFSIPATRLSDGTLRYLCLLAILCDPQPPPLICIEEPELGLHPDILPKLADLFVEASQKTQLIITTHSDVLVDAMTDRPEVVVVCEKHNGQTEMHRLRKDDLAAWLEKYRLGQLWTEGQIGGTRW